MNITFEIIAKAVTWHCTRFPADGRSHPNKGARKIYAEKYMNWWRKGNTRTFGMRLGPDSLVRLFVDGRQTELDETCRSVT